MLSSRCILRSLSITLYLFFSRFCSLFFEKFHQRLQFLTLVPVNLGDDTDTTAAIAGGLAGALYGFDAIPEDWISGLIKSDMIDGLCKKAADNWIPFPGL